MTLSEQFRSLFTRKLGRDKKIMIHHLKDTMVEGHAGKSAIRRTADENGCPNNPPMAIGVKCLDQEPQSPGRGSNPDRLIQSSAH